MPITSTMEITVEYKISDIEISVVKRTILIKITKKLMNGVTTLSSTNFNVLVQGADFIAMATTMPDPAKNLYDNIGTIAYAYCAANNKFV